MFVLQEGLTARNHSKTPEIPWNSRFHGTEWNPLDYILDSVKHKFKKFDPICVVVRAGTFFTELLMLLKAVKIMTSFTSDVPHQAIKNNNKALCNIRNSCTDYSNKKMWSISNDNPLESVSFSPSFFETCFERWPKLLVKYGKKNCYPLDFLKAHFLKWGTCENASLLQGFSVVSHLDMKFLDVRSLYVR